MSERSHEELSALMDGEATELELRRALKSVEGDPELIQKWRRYHVTRSVMQGDLREPQVSSFAKLDISAAVSAAIDHEPAHDVKPEKKSRWQELIIKPLSSVAVAASVSAMVVFGWQSYQQVGSVAVPGANLAQLEASSSQPATYSRTPANSDFVTVAKSRLPVQRAPVVQQEIVRMPIYQDQRLNHYLISHSGNAALNTASGAVSYTRVVHIAP